MSKNNGALASPKAFDPVTIAKKYRISTEDAKAILAQYGEDPKAIHKAARKIAE